MDRLASEGVRFAQCHDQNTVCGPSRCSLMTGWPVHVRGHRSLYYFLHPDEPNLFRYLKQGGYDVYWYGKNDTLSPESFPDSVTDWGPRPARGKGKGNPGRSKTGATIRFFTARAGIAARPATGQRRGAIRILERDSASPFCIYLPWLSCTRPSPRPRTSTTCTTRPRCRRCASQPARKPNFYQAYARPAAWIASPRPISARSGRLFGHDLLLRLDAGRTDGGTRAHRPHKDTAVFLFSDHGEWGGDYGLVEKWSNACDDVLTHVP